MSAIAETYNRSHNILELVDILPRMFYLTASSINVWSIILLEEIFAGSNFRGFAESRGNRELSMNNKKNLRQRTISKIGYWKNCRNECIMFGGTVFIEI